MNSPFVPEVDLEDFFTDEQLVRYRDLFDITVGRVNGSLPESLIPELLQRVKAKPLEQDVRVYLSDVPVDWSVGLDFSGFLDLLVKVNKLKVRADLIDYKKYLNNGKISQFRILFSQVSGGAEGINREQLAALFTRMGLNLGERMLSEIIAEVDKDGSGSIEFEEFASMLAKITNSKKKVIAREYLRDAEICEYKEAFKFFCNDETQVISGADLDRLFRKMGFNLKKEQVDGLLKEFDEDGSGQIEFSEFCVMMIKLRKQRRFRRISKVSCLVHTEISELVHEGMTAQELKDLDYTVQDLKPLFPVVQLLAAGFHISDLLAGSITVPELRAAGLGPLQLKSAGVSSLALRHAAFSAESIRKANRAVAVARWEIGNLPDASASDPALASPSPTKAKSAGAPTGAGIGNFLSARETKLRELTRQQRGGAHLTPRLATQAVSN